MHCRISTSVHAYNMLCMWIRTKTQNGSLFVSFNPSTCWRVLSSWHYVCVSHESVLGSLVVCQCLYFSCGNHDEPSFRWWTIESLDCLQWLHTALKHLHSILMDTATFETWRWYMCSLDGQLKCTFEQIVDGWRPCFDCYRHSPAFLYSCILPLALIGDRMRRNRKLSQCFDLLPFYPECLRWLAWLSCKGGIFAATVDVYILVQGTLWLSWWGSLQVVVAAFPRVV